MTLPAAAKPAATSSTTAERTLAVVGGSGIYAIPGLEVTATHELETPYGLPSAPVIEGRLAGSRLLFLPRHGRHHELAPHEINYRANVCALKKLGAQQLVSLSAVGSLREDIRPGDVVIVDQYIDYTKRRTSTFFENGAVAHVAFAHPACADLGEAAAIAAERAGAPRVHRGGTYVCMEGPQFSTRAESLSYRALGASVIGMTALPEAKLAREAQLPYVTVAFSTDYDAWHETEEAVTVEMVLAVLRQNGALAQRLVAELPSLLPDPSKSPASSALQGALLTPVEHISPSTRARLDWLLPPGPNSP
ncbi:MAG TPA: S-methyl-5'-thioadenosine phosphorylase [Polyangiaceae bacterium]|nr:S-methyl-5'-thioadenosine phosphorylase [Polyangiaceae bacterium]